MATEICPRLGLPHQYWPQGNCQYCGALKLDSKAGRRTEPMRPDRAPEITQHMATFIKTRRSDLGMSLDEIADRAGSSKAHIWALEKGRSKNPTLWMILGLCDALQCSLNSLIGKDVSQPMFTESEMALVDAHRRIFERSAP